MGSWQDYVDFMLMDVDEEGNQMIRQAYLVSTQGEFLAGSEDLPPEYDVEITNDDYSTGTIKCHEVANLMAGWDKGGSATTKAGMRFNTNKFIPIRFDDDANTWDFSAKIPDPEGSGKMLRGGATIGRSGKCFVIGIWIGDLEGKLQYNGPCYCKVERVKNILVEAGF